MNATLSVRMNATEGSLLRLIGLVGRRGFSIRRVEATHTHNGRWLEADLAVTGERSIDTLQRHVSNLHDVETVTVLTRDRSAVDRRIDRESFSAGRVSMTSPVEGSRLLRRY